MEGSDHAQTHLFKIVIIGDSAVGKSNLIARFTRDTFHPNSKTTIGVEFQTYSMVIDGKEIKAQIWDTAGQERFRAVTSAYYRGAMGAVVVYDIARRDTFDNVNKWLQELASHCDTTAAKILVGNKCDMEDAREVSTEEGKALAESHSLFFTEASALDSTNVKIAFEIVIKEIYASISQKALKSDPSKPQTFGKRVSLVRNVAGHQKKAAGKFSCC